MWVKKVYPIDRSKKKANWIRKQRHHAVSTNQLIVPDLRSNSSMKAQWSHLKYGSSNWMLSQLREDEYDDDRSDYDSSDGEMDYADDDVSDQGHSEHEFGEEETDLVEGPVYVAHHGSDGDDITGHADHEQEEAEMMEFVFIDFEKELESEDEWTLIGEI